MPNSANSDFINDMAKISAFLSKSVKVRVRLKQLNEILTERAKERGIYDPQTKGLINYEDEKPYKDDKFLSSYFEEWLIANKFAGLVSYVSELDERDFFAPFKDKYLFKDRYFRGRMAHTQWIHLIQWWCVAEENNAASFLSYEPSEILAQIAEQPDRVKLWDYTFEDLGESNKYDVKVDRARSDFRSGQHFAQWMLCEWTETFGKECKVLHQLIKGKEIVEDWQSPKPEKYADNWYTDKSSGRQIFGVFNRKRETEKKLDSSKEDEQQIQNDYSVQPVV